MATLGLDTFEIKLDIEFLFAAYLARHFRFLLGLTIKANINVIDLDWLVYGAFLCLFLLEAAIGEAIYNVVVGIHLLHHLLLMKRCFLQIEHW